MTSIQLSQAIQGIDAFVLELIADGCPPHYLIQLMVASLAMKELLSIRNATQSTSGGSEVAGMSNSLQLTSNLRKGIEK